MLDWTGSEVIRLLKLPDPLGAESAGPGSGRMETGKETMRALRT